MSDSEPELDSAAKRQPGPPIRGAVRPLVAGIATLFAMTIIGAVLEAWLATSWLDRLGATAVAGVVVAIYVPLLIMPIATGVAVAVTVGYPLTRVLHTRGPSIAVLLSFTVAAIAATITYWFAGNLLAARITQWLTVWVADHPPQVVAHYYYLFDQPRHTLWSVVESLSLTTTLLIVCAAAGLRRTREPGFRVRQAMVATVALTALFGGVFAVHPAHLVHTEIGISSEQ